jgi:hypothetical protein
MSPYLQKETATLEARTGIQSERRLPILYLRSLSGKQYDVRSVIYFGFN